MGDGSCIWKSDRACSCVSVVRHVSNARSLVLIGRDGADDASLAGGLLHFRISAVVLPLLRVAAEAVAGLRSAPSAERHQEHSQCRYREG